METMPAHIAQGMTDTFIASASSTTETQAETAMAVSAPVDDVDNPQCVASYIGEVGTYSADIYIRTHVCSYEDIHR